MRHRFLFLVSSVIVLGSPRAGISDDLPSNWDPGGGWGICEAVRGADACKALSSSVIKFITSQGKRCDKISRIKDSIDGGKGLTVFCNDFRDKYEIEDLGAARWRLKSATKANS